jgi:hypothetical protein
MRQLWNYRVLRKQVTTSPSVIVVRSTNYSTITLIYLPGKMYNRPMCGRSTGTYTNLGDLQRDLMGVKSHPTKKKHSPLNVIIHSSSQRDSAFISAKEIGCEGGTWVKLAFDCVQWWRLVLAALNLRVTLPESSLTGYFESCSHN